MALKVTTAGLAVQAGFGVRGVESFSTPGSGTELQVRGDYNLSKFVQQEYIAPNERQMQVLRDVAAKAKENPEFARKLLAKVKEQESSEPEAQTARC